MTSRKRSFQDAEGIACDGSIDLNESIEIKQLNNNAEIKPEKRTFLSNSAKKLCKRVLIIPNEHDGNKDYSFVYTGKRSSDVFDEQYSSNKKAKLQNLDDEVIVKRQENTEKLTLAKNLDENYLQTSNKPRRLTALLLNGNISSIVNISEHHYQINNTCAFDSVATIISRAFLDNSTYTNFVDANSSSEFLNFCKMVAFRDSADNLNKQRGKILRTIFNEDSGVSNLKIINCECNVMKIVYDLLKDCPSAKDRKRCSNDSCKNHNNCRNSSTIILDEEKLEHLNYLEDMLKDYTKLRTYNCGRCGETILAKRVLSDHLFIEMDQVKRTGKFTMADFPPELNVENYRFVLNGSVNYKSGHYTSHVRRLNQNVWETHNDLKMHVKINTIPEQLIVEPHLVIYTKT